MFVFMSDRGHHQAPGRNFEFFVIDGFLQYMCIYYSNAYTEEHTCVHIHCTYKRRVHACMLSQTGHGKFIIRSTTDDKKTKRGGGAEYAARALLGPFRQPQSLSLSSCFVNVFKGHNARFHALPHNDSLSHCDTMTASVTVSR